MIEPGNPDRLGAVAHDDGAFFAVWSSTAAFVELCLFDDDGQQTMSYRLPGVDGGVHHGFLPGLEPGQLYGFRAHGDWEPERGLRHNPAKLLVDPYARELRGEFRWDYSVFDYASDETPDEPNKCDSAAFVPKCVLTRDNEPLARGPVIPWSETVFYETNVRGYTMQHPEVDAELRGTFRGLTHRAVLEHLKALGITSVELMPVQAYIDENHLARIGLRNYWGYNTLAFMAPMSRFANADPNAEFRDMVNAIHDAGLEVILDVVFNHTCEGNSRGPTLAYKALDNLAYYRTLPDDPSAYVNDTGTGNTVNADHPVVQRLVLDSLKHWSKTMGVDGFRFDLAPVLGRHLDGFNREHPLLQAIISDDALAHAKMIAEPWDPGPGGYQLGQFPGGWAEWNDRFRDGARRFWRGDDGQSGEFARRLHGSADLFDKANRSPYSSVNFISAHDGFTLQDSVSYLERHNEANGENNRDGHAHNYSVNYGVEGPSDDADIVAMRRQHRLNLMASLFFAQGTPMLLAGDEFGNSQSGNNNAYAQDNEIGWVDWDGLVIDPDFTDSVKQLIRLKAKYPMLRLPDYVHEQLDIDTGTVRIAWLSPAGNQLADDEWSKGTAGLLLLDLEARPGHVGVSLAIVVNGSPEKRVITLPDLGTGWKVEFSSAGASRTRGRRFGAAAHSIALLVSEGSAQ